MNESAGIPPGDPLGGQVIAGRWSFGYDMPDELGGGFVAGELLLRGDGVLLRRYGGSSYRCPGRSPGITGHGKWCPGGPAKRIPSGRWHC